MLHILSKAAVRSLNVKIALKSCFVDKSLELNVDRCRRCQRLSGRFSDKIISKNTGMTGYKQMLAAGRRFWYIVSQGANVQISEWNWTKREAEKKHHAQVNEEKSNSGLFQSAVKVKAVHPKPRMGFALQKQQQSSIISLYHSCVPPFVRDSRDRKQFWPQ